MATEVIKHWCLGDTDEKEVLRYLGVRESSPEVTRLLTECRAQAADICDCAVCATVLPINIQGDAVDFGIFRSVSHDLAINLSGCHEAVIFVATIGLGIDRLMKKYAAISPGKALMFSAIGSERIECLCDAYCAQLRERHGAIRPRFSPGYGDLPLSLQTEIFKALDATRQIGVALSDSLLMSPTKSVSAVVGIGPGGDCGIPCETCQKQNCEYRVTT